MPRPPRPLRSRLLVGLVATLSAIALAGAGAAPASAAPAGHRSISYAAIGDSYAAGQATDCTHPATGYPLLLDRLRSVRLVQDLTCAGATTAAVLSGQVPALGHHVRLVTITAGANDLDVAGLAAVCAPDPSSVQCGTAILARQQGLPALAVSIAATVRAVAAAAPRATIVITGYAPLASSGPILAATQALNATIRAAALSAGPCASRVRYVDVRFTGHTLDSAHPWFFAAGPDAFHPTPAGERAYARAIAATLHHLH
jgi:lysophospholipase L1-like esterase